MKAAGISLILILITSLISACRETTKIYLTKDLITLIDNSELVVSGAVFDIQSLQESIISEHDPKLHWASIRVDEVLKGVVASDTIKVLFAASTDIMWFNAPKFTPGDNGIWILTHESGADLILFSPDLEMQEGVYFIDGPSEFQTDIETILNIRNYLKGI